MSGMEMIILVCMILGFAFGFFRDKGWGRIIGSIFCGIIASIASAVMLAPVVFIANNMSPKVVETQITTQRLASFGDGKVASASIDGALFIGIGAMRGSSSTEMKYVFRLMEEDGKTWYDEVPARGKGAVVYEKDIPPSEARMEVHIKYEMPDPSWKWAWLITRGKMFAGKQHRFYVPKGTVQPIFKVDMK